MSRSLFRRRCTSPAHATCWLRSPLFYWHNRNADRDHFRQYLWQQETHLVLLRALRWPEDRASLLALDTSFTTDRVYCLERSAHSFALKEAAIVPAVRKSYPLDRDIDSLNTFDWVQVAIDGED